MSCCGPASSTPTVIQAVVADVDQIRRRPVRRDDLLDYLSERSPFYRGLGSRAAERIRGYIFASFATVGLPDSALMLALEEIETGQDPYAVAGAAIALRGSTRVGHQLLEPLERATRRLSARDEHVQYETFELRNDVGEGRTALEEIEETIRILRGREPAAAARSSCCSSHAGQSSSDHISRPSSVFFDCAMEDQSGTRFGFREFFVGRPSILTFFYTRCMNPERCSLTITKLGRLQRIIRQRGKDLDINLAAVSYDPLYDSAERLRIYGAERAMTFDDRNKLMRNIDGFDALRDTFALNVSYGPSTVNRHGIELLVLDSSATVRHEFRRAKWDEAEAANLAMELVGAD